MVDLQARSEKLVARSRKILIDLFHISVEEAEGLLSRSGGSVKLAIVMQRFGYNKMEAEEKLAEAGGFISKVPPR
jgi:N-acetylmuramic acid 6-phosphate etherase